MHGLLRGVAEGPDVEGQAALFEGEDLLRDERLGKARIAFHDDGDASGCGRGQHRSGYSAAS
jgi:hypothetical protein